MEVRKRVRSGIELVHREKVEGGGEGGVMMERQRERQLICLGDDSPMLGIYSIRREGGREVWGWRSEGASGLGGGQDSIIAPPTGSGGGRDGDRRDEGKERDGDGDGDGDGRDKAGEGGWKTVKERRGG